MCDLRICTGLYVQKGSAPGLMFCCHHLQLLRILSLNLYFVCEVSADNGTCVWAERIHGECVDAFPWHPVQYNIWDALWTQNSSEATLSRHSARLPGSTSSACFTYGWVSRGIPRKPHFLFEPELALGLIERSQWHSKKRKWPRNPIISFLFMLLPWVSPPFGLQMMMWKERKS